MTVIGIDAHKRSHTCVAVNDAGAKLAEKTVASTSAGHAQALRWALTRFGTESFLASRGSALDDRIART